MRLILAGCEYAGTSTLAHAIDDWREAKLGTRFSLIHDHWKVPRTSGHPDDTTDEEQAQILALSPKLKEMVQRHSLYYHIHAPPESVRIGYHIDDSVYGPLYFGYGAEGTRHDRKVVSRQVEHVMLRSAPDVVLVHVKASPDVIRRRMRAAPHQGQVVREEDVEQVLELFEQACAQSMIRSKVTLDTSAATVEETMAEFVKKIEPHLSDTDRLCMLLHRQLQDSQG